MKAAQARVLLTGACGGIGQAAAADLLGAGASLMLVGRSPARLAELARRLTGGRGMPAERVVWHAADLAQAGAYPALADAASSWRCNLLVHGAGVPAFGRLQMLDADCMRAVLELNLLAPMRLTQALLPHLASLDRAQIVFIGSALGRIGVPGFSVYGASKFGLRGFAEALRRELADTGVRVQYLGPRSTRTAFNDAAADAYHHATGSASDEPQRVALALRHLIESERAERYIGFPETLAVRLNGLVAPWLDGAFAKHRRHLPPLTTT